MVKAREPDLSSPVWGEAIDDLLAGVRQAHLTSPASAAFIRLGNAASRSKTGRDLIGETQNLVLSPVVIGAYFNVLLKHNGPLNSFLRDVGLGFLAHQWLNDPNTVVPVMVSAARLKAGTR